MDKNDLIQLVTLKMPYGKYKDRVIADLPGHYLNWFAREGFPRGELGRLLQLMQEIDHNGLKGLLQLMQEIDHNGLKGLLLPLRQNAGISHD